MVIKPTTQYGVIIIVFCAFNTFVVVIPYSDISDKGLELTMVPALFACIVKAYHAHSKCYTPVNCRFDVHMLIVISLISFATFYLPNPDRIWFMMGFIFFVYIPFFLLLLARGLIFFVEGLVEDEG